MKEVRIRRERLPDHPWIYRKQVLRPPPGTRNGDPVRILSKDGTPLGAGLYHGRSRIAIRVLGRDPSEEIDRGFLARRLAVAVRLRHDVLRLPMRTNAYRVVNSEGDGLSGLIVDRYADRLVLVIRSLGVYRLAGEIETLLAEHFPGARPLYRRDAESERIEGFKVPEPRGEPLVAIRSDGLSFEVDLRAGHKTGAFLDQRDSRRFAAELARGRNVLDLFTYEGAFALAAARGGAKRVRGVDLDERAVQRARANAKRNRLDAHFEHGDAFDVLRDRPGADYVLLDPPKWIGSRRDEEEGRRRYLDLNRLAIGALPRGGLLATASCSGLLSPEGFTEIVRRAAHQAGRALRILRIAGAAPDHPVSADFPEGRYLTVLFAVVD